MGRGLELEEYLHKGRGQEGEGGGHHFPLIEVHLAQDVYLQDLLDERKLWEYLKSEIHLLDRHQLIYI